MIEPQTRIDITRPYMFAVDDVAVVNTPIWSEPLSEHVKKRLKRTVQAIPGAERQVTNTQVDSFIKKQQARESSANPAFTNLPRLSPKPDAVNRAHPLIDAVGTAFGQHRPLTLSPDCIWMVIEQGFAHHIAQNDEKFRSRLVRHQGKEELLAKCSGLSLSDFESAIGQFSEQIRQRTDHVLHESLICNFSTTTPEVRTASEVVLMDCYSSYFTYSMMCVCGIPSVTITGTVEDWRQIRSRIEVLEVFELGWWVSRLRPILDEFIRTVEGHPSLEFWKAIYKPEKAYASEVVTGWIADLFPYVNDPPNRKRSPLFDTPRIDWSVPIEDGVNSFFGVRTAKGVSQSSFPSGLASAPVKLILPDGSMRELDFVGGFLAVEQNSRDYSLSPLISWCIAKRAPSKPILL